jgi:hypothetical protein
MKHERIIDAISRLGNKISVLEDLVEEMKGRTPDESLAKESKAIPLNEFMGGFAEEFIHTQEGRVLGITEDLREIFIEPTGVDKAKNEAYHK